MIDVSLESTYTVTGMTCSHCALSVSEEVREVSGVADVDVDLATGVVTVTGDADPEAVVAAVTDAGYAVVGR